MTHMHSVGDRPACRFLRPVVRSCAVVLVAALSPGSVAGFDAGAASSLLALAEREETITIDQVRSLLGEPMGYMSRLGRQITTFDPADLPHRYMMVYAWVDGQGNVHSHPEAFGKMDGQEAFTVDVVNGVPSSINWSFFPMAAVYMGLAYGMSVDEFVAVVEPRRTIESEDGSGPEGTGITRRGEYPAIGLEVYRPRDRILFMRSHGPSSYLDLDRRLLVVLTPIRGEPPQRVYRLWALLNSRLVDPLAGKL